MKVKTPFAKSIPTVVIILFLLMFFMARFAPWLIVVLTGLNYYGTF